MRFALARRSASRPASMAAARLQFDLSSNGSRPGTAGTVAIKNGTFGWVGAAAAVQDLNINVALDGEQLTIERISGNVATGGIVGSFSAKGAAKLPELTLAAVDGAIVLDSARFTFSGIPVEQQRPSRIEFAKGNVTMYRCVLARRREPADFWRHHWTGGRRSAARPFSEGPRRPPHPLRLYERGRVRRQRRRQHAHRGHVREAAARWPHHPRRRGDRDCRAARGPVGTVGTDRARWPARGVRRHARSRQWRRACARRLARIRSHGAQRRRAEHPGAGRRDRDAQGSAQRARCADDLPSRSAQPVADRRYPHHAERLYRDDYDRCAGAAGVAAGHGGAGGRAAVSRSAAAESRGHDHRRCDRRQQLRPACRRRRSSG